MQNAIKPLFIRGFLLYKLSTGRVLTPIPTGAIIPIGAGKQHKTPDAPNIMETIVDCKHVCVPACGKYMDCPCQTEHFCQNSKDTPDYEEPFHCKFCGVDKVEECKCNDDKNQHD